MICLETIWFSTVSCSFSSSISSFSSSRVEERSGENVVVVHRDVEEREEEFSEDVVLVLVVVVLVVVEINALLERVQKCHFYNSILLY